MKRYAIVRNARSRREAEAYLPGNYRIVHEFTDAPDGGALAQSFVIEGEDNAGWTLDGYVIPRYASGIIACREIDLSHPEMKAVRSSGCNADCKHCGHPESWHSEDDGQCPDDDGPRPDSVAGIVADDSE